MPLEVMLSQQADNELKKQVYTIIRKGGRSRRFRQPRNPCVTFNCKDATKVQYSEASDGMTALAKY